MDRWLFLGFLLVFLVGRFKNMSFLLDVDDVCLCVVLMFFSL